MFRNIDEKLEALGFVKRGNDDCESEYGVYYQREDMKHNFIQFLDICRKASGRHLISSYQKDTNVDGFNNSVGLTYEEMKLVMKKYRQMKRKYKWK